MEVIQWRKKWNYGLGGVDNELVLRSSGTLEYWVVGINKSTP